MITLLKKETRRKTFGLFKHNTDLEFNKLNVFIGPNNSGKSLFMRELLKRYIDVGVDDGDEVLAIADGETFDPDMSQIELYEKLGFVEAMKIIEEAINESFDQDNQVTIDEVHVFERFINDCSDFQINRIEPVPKNVLISDISEEDMENHEYDNYDIPLSSFRDLYDVIIDSYCTEFKGNKEIWLSIYRLARSKSINALIIPITRTLKNPSLTHSNVWRSDYHKKYDINEEYIYTGEDINDEIAELQSGGQIKQDKLDEICTELSRVSFLNTHNISRGATEIRESDLFFKIDSDARHSIYNLGDGLQSVLIIQMAIKKLREDPDSGGVLFIEEPEIFLHPSLLRSLVRYLLDVKKVQFFITTHSTYFLDILQEESEKTSIFRFQKQNKAAIKIQHLNSPDLALLGDLGVTNGAALIANCSIWVEGLSDKLYIQKYLSLHPLFKKRNFREGLHYSFVEYSGNNLNHWAFNAEAEEQELLKPLIKQILVIADADKGKETKHGKYEALLKDNYYKLECLEIENTIPVRALKETVKTLSKLTTLEEGESIDKSDIADYSQERIANVIHKIPKGTRKLVYKGVGLVNKVQFAREAVKHITDYKELPDSAINLTDKVFRFILRHNK